MVCLICTYFSVLWRQLSVSLLSRNLFYSANKSISATSILADKNLFSMLLSSSYHYRDLHSVDKPAGLTPPKKILLCSETVLYTSLFKDFLICRWPYSPYVPSETWHRITWIFYLLDSKIGLKKQSFNSAHYQVQYWSLISTTPYLPVE